MQTECIIGIGSVTQAMRARSALGNAGIASEVTRLLPGESKYGCEYGLRLPCPKMNLAKTVLERESIKFRRIDRNGKG